MLWTISSLSGKEKLLNSNVHLNLHTKNHSASKSMETNQSEGNYADMVDEDCSLRRDRIIKLDEPLW
jgi:hypothetical protein